MYNWKVTISALLCPCRDMREDGTYCTVNWEKCSEENCEKLGKEVEPKVFKGEGIV